MMNLDEGDRYKMAISSSSFSFMLLLFRCIYYYICSLQYINRATISKSPVFNTFCIFTCHESNASTHQQAQWWRRDTLCCSLHPSVLVIIHLTGLFAYVFCWTGLRILAMPEYTCSSTVLLLKMPSNNACLSCLCVSKASHGYFCLSHERQARKQNSHYISKELVLFQVQQWDVLMIFQWFDQISIPSWVHFLS